MPFNYIQLNTSSIAKSSVFYYSNHIFSCLFQTVKFHYMMLTILRSFYEFSKSQSWLGWTEWLLIYPKEKSSVPALWGLQVLFLVISVDYSFSQKKEDCFWVVRIAWQFFWLSQLITHLSQRKVLCSYIMRFARYSFW